VRVALVLPYAPEANRGNSTAARRLARGLAAAGAAVEMASLEALGIPFGPAGVDAARRRLVPALASFRPDVLHALHGYRSGPAGVAAARALGAALVVGLRGTDVSVDLKDPGRRDDLLAALEAADAVVAFADFMLAPILAARPALASRSTVVPHGIAERFFVRAGDGSGRLPPALPRRPPGGTLFLMPANLRPIKTPDLAVAGLDPVAATRPGVRLAIAGPTLDPTVGARLAAAVAARPWATLLGEVPHADMPALFRAADVVLNTSRAEGMSNAVLEAMAGGRAVLLSDIPAHRAMVDPEVSGLLFDLSGPDGGAAALARLAARLADDPALRVRLGEGAATRARARHTVAEEARRILAVYEAAMARRAACRGGAR
jgi:glycosyltransferase involved in cell wall biosynthesis